MNRIVVVSVPLHDDRMCLRRNYYTWVLVNVFGAAFDRRRIRTQALQVAKLILLVYLQSIQSSLRMLVSHLSHRLIAHRSSDTVCLARAIFPILYGYCTLYCTAYTVFYSYTA